MAKKPTKDELCQSLPGYRPEADRPACQRCHKPLPLAPMGVHNDTVGGEARYYGPVAPEQAVKVQYGYAGDGCFCTLRCGYLYGLRVVHQRLN